MGVKPWAGNEAGWMGEKRAVLFFGEGRAGGYEPVVSWPPRATKDDFTETNQDNWSQLRIWLSDVYRSRMFENPDTLRDTGALQKGEKSWQRQAQHKYISAFPSRHTRRDIAGLHKGFLVWMCVSLCLMPNIQNIKV